MQKIEIFASPDAKIPTCRYLLRYPTRNLKVAFYPTSTPDASQWNIFMLGIYISCCLCQFHLRQAPFASSFFSVEYGLLTTYVFKVAGRDVKKSQFGHKLSYYSGWQKPQQLSGPDLQLGITRPSQ